MELALIAPQGRLRLDYVCTLLVRKRAILEAPAHVVMWLARPLVMTRPDGVWFPDQACFIIRCKNLALNIIDCLSPCLSEDTPISRNLIDLYYLLLIRKRAPLDVVLVPLGGAIFSLSPVSIIETGDTDRLKKFHMLNFPHLSYLSYMCRFISCLAALFYFSLVCAHLASFSPCAPLWDFHSHGRTTLTVFFCHFLGRLRYSVFISDMTPSYHYAARIRLSILIPFTSSRASCPFVAAQVSAQYNRAGLTTLL